MATESHGVRDRIREGYATIAEAGSWSATKSADGGACCSGGGCCGPATLSAGELAASIGYSKEELAGIPVESNLGLSCGNPGALAALKAGEVVLDLGSGAGFDCFLAGPRVGKRGRVIGVDMTPSMLTKARGNLGHYRQSTGLDNIEFRLGEIEHLPLADASVDVVISNCVLNLSPDKAQVWREIARVLKPGGRVAVSDLALLRALPESVVADLEALVGCIAGAELIEETRRHAEEAGLVGIEIAEKADYVRAMTTWKDPLYLKIAESLPEGTTIADYVTSADISATRPG